MFKAASNYITVLVPHNHENENKKHFPAVFLEVLAKQIMNKIIYLILGQRPLFPVAIASCFVQRHSQYFLIQNKEFEQEMMLR